MGNSNIRLYCECQPAHLYRYYRYLGTNQTLPIQINLETIIRTPEVKCLSGSFMWTLWAIKWVRLNFTIPMLRNQTLSHDSFIKSDITIHRVKQKGDWAGKQLFADNISKAANLWMSMTEAPGCERETRSPLMWKAVMQQASTRKSNEQTVLCSRLHRVSRWRDNLCVLPQFTAYSQNVFLRETPHSLQFVTLNTGDVHTDDK